MTEGEGGEEAEPNKGEVDKSKPRARTCKGRGRGQGRGRGKKGGKDSEQEVVDLEDPGSAEPDSSSAAANGAEEVKADTEPTKPKRKRKVATETQKDDTAEDDKAEDDTNQDKKKVKTAKAAKATKTEKQNKEAETGEAKSKIPKAEEKTTPAVPKSKKRPRDGECATFARRYLPKVEPSASKWKALKDVFNQEIKPKVAASSKLQDWWPKKRKPNVVCLRFLGF